MPAMKPPTVHQSKSVAVGLGRVWRMLGDPEDPASGYRLAGGLQRRASLRCW
jgi:hypothetical protein